MTADDFESHLGMLLRDQPRGITADLADGMVAFWDGRQVVFAFLCEQGTGHIDEDFDLADYVWGEWESQFEAWVAAPTFSPRRELLDWLKSN